MMVKFYSFRKRMSDGQVYGGEIPAESKAEAEQMARQIGGDAVVWVVEQKCASCGHVLYKVNGSGADSFLEEVDDESDDFPNIIE